MSKLVYPKTRRSDHVDVYHGQSINDPYNWLEHPDDKEVIDWVDQQNKVTQEYLSESTTQSINQSIKKRLEELYDYPRFGCPYHRQNKLFYFKNSGLQNQSVLYMQTIKTSPSTNQSLELMDDEQVLLDPNQFSTDGTAALGSMKFSEDGKMLAYGVSRAGSDWQSIEIIDCHTKQQLTINQSTKEKLDWVKFSSISWSHDNKGFFYSRYPTPKEFVDQSIDQSADPSATKAVEQTEKAGSETSSLANQALYYHTIGTDQSADRLVYRSIDHPDWMMHGEVSDDGNWLLISISESTEPVNRLYYAKLINQSYTRTEPYDDQSTDQSADRLIKLVDHFKHEYSYITNDQSTFYFKTNRDAPKYRVIRTDFNDEQAVNQSTNDDARWIEVIPQHETDVLNAITCVNENKFICVYMHNAHEILSMFTLTNQSIDQSKTQQIKLPDLGSIAGLSSRKEDNFFFYQFTSFIDPGQIIRVDVNDQSINQTVFRTSHLKSFDPSRFETEQIFYESKDGTKIPMFVIGARDQSTDQSTKRTPKPCFLYGYGGFNISLTPSFAVSRAFFLGHFDGYYVVANIRGGGEFGEAHHKAGTKLNKQNVFDDFIYSAKYLIQEGYTTSQQLIINGGSNGGLLVGACVNQCPELFGAAVAAVGVLDMLKFHKFTIGWAWKSDYGSSEDPAEFEYLLKYSPVHNVKTDRPYPALLLTTGDHDDRVVPLHSYKYISEVQHALGDKPEQVNPLLIRIETNAGHGAGMPLSKRIQEQADVFTFIAKALKLQVKL